MKTARNFSPLFPVECNTLCLYLSILNLLISGTKNGTIKAKID